MASGRVPFCGKLLICFYIIEIFIKDFMNDSYNTNPDLPLPADRGLWIHLLFSWARI